MRKQVNSVYSADKPYSKDRPNLSTLYGINKGSDSLNLNGFESEEATRESLGITSFSSSMDCTKGW